MPQLLMLLMLLVLWLLLLLLLLQVTPSYTEAMDAMTTLLAGAQAGFFTELQRRLGGGGLSPVVLDLLVMPVLHKGSWSVALLCNLEATASVRWDAAGSATSQATSQMPYILFFDPLDPSNKMASRSEVKAVTYLLGLSMLQRIRLQGHYGLDNVKFESVPTGASSKQLLTQKHESGARVILFVKAFLNAIAVRTENNDRPIVDFCDSAIFRVDEIHSVILPVHP